VREKGTESVLDRQSSDGIMQRGSQNTVKVYGGLKNEGNEGVVIAQKRKMGKAACMKM
jgi:hypothetical protein